MSLAKPLALAGFVAVPVAAAVVVSLLSVWPPLGPLLLAGGGLGYLVLAARLATGFATVEDDAEAKRAFGERILDDNPFTIFMPFLFIGGLLLIAIGLVWLAFVDLLISVVVLALGIVAALWWKRRAPGRRATETDD